MEKIIDSFTAHPQSVGEGYFEHMGVAVSCGAALLRAGLACLVHAVFPFLFTTTARTAIADLHGRIVTHRDRRPHDAHAPRDLRNHWGFGRVPGFA